MKLKEVDTYFKTLFNPEEFVSSDPSWNGLQVGDFEKEIKKTAFAVDACMESFSHAAEKGADLLFVHHGLFWGKGSPVTGTLYERLHFLIKNNLALYAMHLPLDAHEEVGNNAAIVRELGLQEIVPFGEHGSRKIGFKGVFSEPKNLDAVLERMNLSREECSVIYPFGKDAIVSVGVVSGGASDDVTQAIGEDLDLFITGEGTHQVYHTCLEGRVNMVAAGHYHTERYGVQSTAAKCSRDTGLDTFFIDVPTGL